MSKIVTQDALRSALETLVGHLPAESAADCNVIQIEGIFDSTDARFKNYLWYHKESEKTNYTSKHAGCYVAFFRDLGAFYLVNSNAGSTKINAFWSDREDFVKYPALYTTRLGHGLIQVSADAGCSFIGKASLMELVDSTDLEAGVRFTVTDDNPDSINAAASLGGLRQWLNTAGISEISSAEADTMLLVKDGSGINQEISVDAVDRYVRRNDMQISMSAQDLIAKLFGKIGTNSSLLAFMRSGYNGATLTAFSANNFHLRLEKVFGFYGHGLRIEGPWDIDATGSTVTNSQTWHQYMIWYGASAITATSMPTSQILKSY